MIVINDLREVTEKRMEQKMPGVFSSVVDRGAPETVRATLSDESSIVYDAIGTFVIVQYEDQEYRLLLSDFATMEIL